MCSHSSDASIVMRLHRFGEPGLGWHRRLTDLGAVIGRGLGPGGRLPEQLGAGALGATSPVWDAGVLKRRWPSDGRGLALSGPAFGPILPYGSRAAGLLPP